MPASGFGAELGTVEPAKAPDGALNAVYLVPDGDEQRRNRRSIETGEPAPPTGQRCLCDSRHQTASQPAKQIRLRTNLAISSERNII
jgi:hypothetical protein